MCEKFEDSIEIYYAKLNTETFLINSRRSYEKEIENWKYLIENKHSKKNPSKIYDDGSIGYKYLVKDCSDEAYVPYKILSGNSYPGMVE